MPLPKSTQVTMIASVVFVSAITVWTRIDDYRSAKHYAKLHAKLRQDQQDFQEKLNNLGKKI